MTTPHIPCATQFNLKIGQCRQSVLVDHRTLANTVVSHDLDEAKAKREWRERFSDYFLADIFGWTKQEDVITALWQEAKADTTENLEKRVLELGSLAEDPAKFAAAFTLKTEKDTHGLPCMSIHLSGQQLSTTPFPGQMQNSLYFTQSAIDEHLWNLSAHAVKTLQYRQFRQKLAASENSVALQSDILEILTAHPELARDLVLKVTAGEQNTLVTISLLGEDDITFAGNVALDPHLFKKDSETGDFRLNPINFKDYQPVFTRLYCPENSEQNLTDEIQNNPSIQQSNEIKEMQQGEPLSYQDAEFRAQVCRDLPRQRGALSPEKEREFTKEVIQLFAPDCINALNDHTRPIYDNFCQLTIKERQELCPLLKQIKDHSVSTNLSDHSHVAILEPFEDLSESEQEAFFELAERNARFSFKPDELQGADSESLGYIAQISSQGTLFLAEQIKHLLGGILGRDKIHADQRHQQLSHTIVSESESKLAHTWTIEFVQADYSAKAIETPILKVTTHFHFETLKDQKAEEILIGGAGEMASLKQRMAKADASISDIQAQINNKVTEEEKENTENESEQLIEMRRILYAKKNEKLGIFEELQKANTVADANSATMTLTDYKLEIKLAHPEVAHAAKRIVNQPDSPAGFKQTPVKANSNLYSDSNLFRGIISPDPWTEIVSYLPHGMQYGWGCLYY